ncbi:MAG TPA: AMP-binding protein, partial [Verrucomicrobium sp.]|nr:AMP-binding protein [Verrucomicrobium sp.]
PSISTILESLAARQPGKVAVTGVARQIDYANLNNTANALAQKLILPPGQRAGRVALLMKHDAPLIAAALGVLKAGQTVVVLNPGDPPFRWQQLLANAMPDRLITDASLLVSARETGFDLSQILVFPEPEDTPTRVPDPGVRVDENDAAFLVYTSGTTGEPKGVVLTHGSIVHNAWRYALGLGLRPNDRMLLSTALSGGQGVGTTWTALLNGATLCPYAIVEKGAVGLTAWLVEKKVSIFVATASAFRHLMLTLSDGEKLSGIRLVRLASEHATSGDHQLFAKHFSLDCQLATAYSTSETGNLTLGFYSPTDEVAAGRLPAGKPSPEIALRICDAAGKVVPRGTAGELVVQARHLSRGYWRNEELTKMRFAEVPGSSPVLRSYKTGDMACWNEKGDLVILGRADSQVKIRGYRVELGAVEAALEALDGVARAVVLPFEFHGGDTQLGTFLIPTEGTVLDGAKIRRTLMRTLPSAMIPARFSFLESFPLTSHGKVDRQALRQLSAPVVGPETNTEPLNDTEEILAGIWGMAMKRPAVGRRDNFFELGGD